MSTDPSRLIRRILLALEPGSGMPPDVEAIVALAERLHAEIVGLVVEDVNLLRSASLPFVHQVSLLTGAPEALDVDWVEREMHRATTDVEERFRRAAESRRVRWSLRVVRGHVTQELAGEVRDGDLIVIETPRAPRIGAPDTATAAVRIVRRPVLVLHPGDRLVGRPVLVVFDGTDEAVTALRLATLISEGNRGIVEVALLAPTHEQRNALEEAARQALEGYGGTIKLHRLTNDDPRRACALAERLGSALLFVGAQSTLLQEKGLSQVLDELRCAVWVVR